MLTHIQSLFNIAQPSPLQKLDVSWTQFHSADGQAHQVELWCKRDELLHSVISGNKWRKLVKPIQQFVRQPPAHVLSFGGPYSNHLHALSYCCNKLNIKFTALVRGEYLRSQALNPTLQDLRTWNTDILFVDKHTYQRRNDSDYLNALRKQLGADVIIPEGGSQQDALAGMQDMIEELAVLSNDKAFDAIVLPVGSGASMAGVLEASLSSVAKCVIGIGVLKGEGYLESLVSQFLTQTPRTPPYLPWHIDHNFHFGGYGKSSQQLDTFCQSFNQEQATQFASPKKDTPIFDVQNESAHKKDTPLNKCSTASNSDAGKSMQALAIEPVYSGKCFFAVKSLIQKGYFAPNSRVLVIHTGGLQGAR